jgi:hypothetical protein
MKNIVLILLALALVASGYSQEVVSTTVSSSQTVSARGGSASVATGHVPSTLTHAPGLVKNAPLIDWTGPEVRRRETFNADGQPYAVFIARNGCAFGLRHEHEVMTAIRALMKPGEQLMTDPSGFYYIGFDTLVSVLTAGPAANPGVQNITQGAGIAMASVDQVVITPGTGTPVSGQVATIAPDITSQVNADGVVAESNNHPTLGPITVFRRSIDKKLVAGERGRPIAESLAGGKPVQVIPPGNPGAGAYYTK